MYFWSWNPYVSNSDATAVQHVNSTNGCIMGLIASKQLYWHSGHPLQSTC
jgi:hypothetical protein